METTKKEEVKWTLKALNKLIKNSDKRPYNDTLFDSDLFLNTFFSEISKNSPKDLIKKIVGGALLLESLKDNQSNDQDFITHTESMTIEYDDTSESEGNIFLSMLGSVRTTSASVKQDSLKGEVYSEILFSLLRGIQFLVEEKKLTLEKVVNSRLHIVRLFSQEKNFKDVVSINPNFLRSNFYKKMNYYNLNERIKSDHKKNENESSVLLRMLIIIYCFEKKIFGILTHSEILELIYGAYEGESYDKRLTRAKSVLGIKSGK